MGDGATTLTNFVAVPSGILFLLFKLEHLEVKGPTNFGILGLAATALAWVLSR